MNLRILLDLENISLVLMMIRLIQNFQEKRLKKRQLADRMNIFASTVHRKNNRRRKNDDLTDREYVKKINSYLKLHQLAEYYSPKLSKDGKFYFINYDSLIAIFGSSHSKIVIRYH